MAISFVQHKTGATTFHASSSVDIVLDSATTSGNILVAGISSYGATQTCTGITDNYGNTWTKLGSVNRSSADDTLDLFYAKNITGGAGHDILIQMAGVENIGGSIIEYSGADTTSPIDGSINTGTGNSSSSAAGSITPSVDNCMIVAFGTDQILATTTVTAGSGFTLRGMAGTADNSVRIYSEEFLQGTAGSVNAGFTLSASSTWCAGAIVLKPATGGGPTLPPFGTLMMMGCGR